MLLGAVKLIHKYRELLSTLPPHIVLSIAWRKLRRYFARTVGRLHARMSKSAISDASFLCALDERLITATSLLEQVSSKEESLFFLQLNRRQDYIDSFRTFYPSFEALEVEAANRVSDHVFDLLGSGPTRLGDKIDWHIDFKTNHRFSPHQYYADVRPAPYPGGYDIKIPWELSRCQHFAWLGQAYWFTEDEKYAEGYVAQVEDWIENNPYPWGVNWTCTMDVAIRVVNWLWGYHFFQESPTLSNQFRLSFYKSLLIHGRHIFRNLENEGDFTGNHYLSNIVGLAYLGILCPEFKEARQWRDFGLRELEKEMFKQVYPDGVNYEASTSYHRLVLEMFLSATILAQRNGYSFSYSYMQRLEKMVGFLMYLTKPDGTAPLFGDNDNGRLHRLKVWDPPEREWTDFRYLLAIGAVLFRREDFAQAADDQWEEAIWLCGKQAIDFKLAMQTRVSSNLRLASRAFPDAGLFVMRHEDQYLLIGAGPNGQKGNGGHAHNDSLSFELHINDQTWILDPGSYVYTQDYDARNRYRSTAFHNTVAVDAKEQNPFSSSYRDIFRLPDIARTRVKVWQTTDDYTLFVGEHHGYARLSPPVIHERAVFYDRMQSAWIIHDRLLGRRRHQAATHLHFAPGLRLQIVNETIGSVKIRADNGRSAVFLSALHGVQSLPAITSGNVSLGYGIEQAASVAVWEWEEQSSEFVLALTAESPLAVADGERVSTAYRRYREVLQHVAGTN